MRKAWSAALTSVVVVLVAGVLAGLVHGVWSSRNPGWESMTSLTVSPLPDTGDPDRVIATQIEVLESRTQRAAIAGALVEPAPFTIDAEQRRLSDVVDVTVTSTQRDTATRAAAVLEGTYPARAGGGAAPTVRVAVLDPPLAATRSDDVLRDALLVGLGAAALAVAALVLVSALRPRVKRSYADAPVDAVVLELPEPGRPGSPLREACASELRRFSDRVLAPPGVEERPRPRVTALAGVDRATLGWVTDVLDGTPDTVHEPGAPDERRPQSVVVTRSGVDTEIALRKEVQSRAVFSDVMVVLLGAARPALVVPAGDSGSTRASGDVGRSDGPGTDPDACR